MSGPFVEELTPLPARLSRYYRDLLAAHANDSTTGACPICLIGCCQDWRYAWIRLVSAGECPAADQPAASPQAVENTDMGSRLF
jgi:hypothetical protein